MRDDELDRILSEEPDIAPSSGFASSVMDAVRHQALTPPPIPFPWKRALPGLGAWGIALVLVFTMARSTAASPAPAWFTSPLTATHVTAAGLIILALLLSLASVKLSMRLTRG